MSDTAGPERPTCAHCQQHPSIVTMNDLPLCIDCYGRVQATERNRVEAEAHVVDVLSRMINYLSAEAEAAVGLPGLVSFPRIPLPQPSPIIQTGPMTFQNVNIHDNAIGVLNTGTIQHLDARIGEVRTGGNPELAEALKSFVESVANADELDPAEREDRVRSPDPRGGSAPENVRRMGLLRGAVRRIAEIATTVTAVGMAWTHLEPLLRAALPGLFS